jgi:hypothetical protein
VSEERVPEAEGGCGAGGWEGSGAERGHAPLSFGKVIFLLKPIRQSISGCRNPREDVHLCPRSRRFEGKFDGKV